MVNETEKLLREFLIIYKMINRKAIVDILKAELKTDQLVEIYQKTNGENSSRELANVLKNKCSHATISNTWNKWALLGIVIPAKQKGRYMAAFDLAEYGIAKVENDGGDQ